MSDVKKCPHCGGILHSGAMYCMYCMTSLTPKKDITPEVPERKTGIVIACVLFAVVVLLGCFLFLGKKSVLHLGKRQMEERNKEETPSGQTEDDNLLPSASETQDTTLLLEETEPEIPVSPENPGNEPDDPVTPPPSQNDSQLQEPDVNIPTPTQPVCNHYYLTATCIAPATCQKCGDILGSVDDNAHVWKPVTAVIHHEEVGHYELVEDYYEKTVYLCFFCGYNQDGFDSLDDLREHITVHSQNSTYEMIVSAPDLHADTRKVWATRPVEKWVIDQKAYDETVTTGYVCTICNQQKDP